MDYDKDLQEFHVTEELSFQLTEMQRHEKSEQLIQLKNRLNCIQKTYKEAKEALRKEAREVQKEIDLLFGALISGAEKKKVNCVKVVSYEDEISYFLYENEIIEERDLTSDDMQRELKIEKTGNTNEVILPKDNLKIDGIDLFRTE